MEKKIEKLQKELKESREYTQSLLRNNILYPQRSQNTRRTLNYETFELKRPVPKSENTRTQPNANESTSDSNKNQRTQPNFSTSVPINEFPPQPNENSGFSQQNPIFQNQMPQNQAPQNEFLPQNQVPQNQAPQNEFLPQNQFHHNNLQQQNQGQNNEYMQRNQMHFENPNRVNFVNEDNNQNVLRPRYSFLRRLKAIPIFSGGSYTELREFIDVTDTLFVSIQNNSEEMEFYDQLLPQIRGEA